MGNRHISGKEAHKKNLQEICYVVWLLSSPFCWCGLQNRPKHKGRCVCYSCCTRKTIFPAVCGEPSKWSWLGSLVLHTSRVAVTWWVRSDQVTQSLKPGWVGETDFRVVGKFPPALCSQEYLLGRNARAHGRFLINPTSSGACTGSRDLDYPLVDPTFFSL